jgi:hypothetical protein
LSSTGSRRLKFSSPPKTYGFRMGTAWRTTVSKNW